jgi:hypothetical protein
MDVVTAYLYGSLDSDIYMKVPDMISVPNTNVGRNMYCVKLKKSLYELKQSERMWYNLSVPCRPGTPVYMPQVKTESGVSIHTLPRAMRYRTLAPCQGGLWGRHVSSGFEPHLPAREGSGAATCTMAPNPIPAGEGSGAATRPAVPCGPRVTSIKKTLAGLPT